MRLQPRQKVIKKTAFSHILTVWSAKTLKAASDYRFCHMQHQQGCKGQKVSLYGILLASLGCCRASTVYPGVLIVQVKINLWAIWDFRCKTQQFPLRVSLSLLLCLWHHNQSHLITLYTETEQIYALHDFLWWVSLFCERLVSLMMRKSPHGVLQTTILN